MTRRANSEPAKESYKFDLYSFSNYTYWNCYISEKEVGKKKIAQVERILRVRN